MRLTTATRTVAALVLVATATGLGLLTDAHLTVCALMMLVAVLFSAVLGPWPATVGAVTGLAALDWFFTPPRHSFRVTQDLLVEALVFVIAAALISWVVSRLAFLRAQADRHAREAQIRVELTNRLASGEDPASVAQSTAEAMVSLFSFTTCRVRLGDATALARGPGDEVAGARERLEVDNVAIEGNDARRPLSADERAVLEALVAALSAAWEVRRLHDEKREDHITLQVGQSRARLLSAVSHNLRTPLASIKAATSTLRSPDARLDADDRRDLLDTVIDETERLERMVTKTLDLSRIRAGGLKPEPDVVEIGDIASAAARRLRPVTRGHRVRLALDPDVPAVALDVAMMEDVFTNLLENALRFAPPGSEIVVAVRATGREHERAVEVRVIDHGPGVPVQARSDVFEEFVRVEARPDSSGTGLGLAIVRAYVAAHGGRVWVEDTPGGGATFVLRLPSEAR